MLAASGRVLPLARATASALPPDPAAYHSRQVRYQALSACGAAVAVNDVVPERAAEVAQVVAGGGSGAKAVAVPGDAASEAGVPVKPEVWALAREYWTRSQKQDGSWAYTPDSPASSASMTCAGVSSLIIAGSRRYESLEIIQGESIRDCGRVGTNPPLDKALTWLAGQFQVARAERRHVDRHLRRRQR